MDKLSLIQRLIKRVRALENSVECLEEENRNMEDRLRTYPPTEAEKECVKSQEDYLALKEMHDYYKAKVEKAEKIFHEADSIHFKPHREEIGFEVDAGDNGIRYRNLNDFGAERIDPEQHSEIPEP